MTEQNIKVCHFTSVHHWNDVRIFEKECVALAEAGFEVHLVAPNAQEGLQKKVHVHSVNFKPQSRMERMRKMAKLVYEKALSLNADIYHFHDPEMLPYGLKLQKKGKKVIYDAHEDVPTEILQKNWIPKTFRKIISNTYNAYEKNTVRKLSGLISVVEVITDKFTNTHKLTLKNFPDLSSFKFQDGPRENSIIYSGGLMKKRGIKEIIQAIGYTETKPKLVILGKWESAEYESTCTSLPEWKYVEYLGYVPLEESYRQLAKAKVGLTVVHGVGQNPYSLPIKSFEYMASGLASINSNFPYWKKLFGDTALYVDPTDIQGIAHHIDTLISNEEIRNRLAENGRKMVKETFNWDREKEKLIQFYKQILGLE